MQGIPKTFYEWKVCIEKQCGIPLTAEFAKQRLTVYRNENLSETQRFISLYGRNHLEHILAWFERFLKEHG